MTSIAAKHGDSMDYTTEEKIKALYELQKIDSKIDEINKIKGELPLEVQDLEDEIAGLETRISNILNEIEKAKALIAKYEEQEKNVRNNREYESLAKEIELQKLEIELCEKKIKEYNSDVKMKKKLVEECKGIADGRRVDLKSKQDELASIDQETAKVIEDLTKESEAAAERIDSRLLTAYQRIRGNARNGLAVVTVKRDACGGCYNRIPPQRQFDIRMSKKIIVCEYCGRILVSDLLDNE